MAKRKFEHLSRGDHQIDALRNWLKSRYRVPYEALQLFNPNGGEIWIGFDRPGKTGSVKYCNRLVESWSVWSDPYEILLGDGYKAKMKIAELVERSWKDLKLPITITVERKDY